MKNTNIIKIAYCFAVLLGLSLVDLPKVHAQQDPQSSLYMFNPMFYNPAYAGSRGSINATTIYRHQWLRMEGAPKTGFLSVHGPIKNQSIGLGLSIANDNIGARNNFSAFANFSYAVRLNKKNHRLAFGVSGGVDYMQYNYNGLRVIDPTDPSYYETYNNAVPNFGFGVYYYGERHYFGVSTPRMLQNKFSNGTADARMKRHFYVTGGYVFKLSSTTEFKPSALIKITENAPVTFDLNANFLFFNKFWFGGQYRYHESAGLMAAFNITEWLNIGYAYDFPVNGLLLNQWGTHEVMLGFDFKTKKKSIMSPRYF